MFTTLFSSEALMGALIGATVTLLGVLINSVMETLKEARRERSSRLSEVRKELGLDQGVQGSGVMVYISSERTWWPRFLLLFNIVLSHPDLSNANLRRVNLAGKDLRGVNFSFADLTEADLSHANIEDANFRGAILIKTDLRDAKFGHTNFREAVVFDSHAIHRILDSDAITNISGLEKRFGKSISSPEELEKLLKSIGVDTASISIKEMYSAFKVDR